MTRNRRPVVAPAEAAKEDRQLLIDGKEERTVWTPRRLDGDVPLYLAIADQIQHDVASGRLTEGERLPPQRELAAAAEIDLTTASRAYAEAARRGLVVSQVGRGTFIAAAPTGEGSESPCPVDMSLNFPFRELPAAAAEALAPLLAKLTDRESAHALLNYGASGGSGRHRSAGARWLAKRGVGCPPSQVVVTAGGQHALTVLVMALCTSPRALMTDELTYPGLKSLAEQLGIELIPLARDDQGVLPASLRAVAAERRTRIVYLNPTLHNPSTATMPGARRREICAVAAKQDLLIIEDDAYGLLVPNAPAPLQAIAPERVFHVSSLAKVVAPGLRTAFVAVPSEKWFERLSATVRATIWMAPPLPVEIAASWIIDGTAERLLEIARFEATRRQKVAAEIWRGMDWQAQPSSAHGWLLLPEHWTTAEFVLQARLAGISVTPAEAFWIRDSAAPAAVRLSLSAVADLDMLRHALSRLRRIVEAGPNSGAALV